MLPASPSKPAAVTRTPTCFARKSAGPATKGRDLLYVFMRHWLAARLKIDRPKLYARLPVSYASGAPLL